MFSVLRARRGDICIGPDIINFHLFSRNHEKKLVGIAEEVIFKEAGQNDHCPPLFNLDEQDAQILMNDLWDAGLRPAEARGSAGAMKAVQDHLADMRKIAFKKLSIT